MQHDGISSASGEIRQRLLSCALPNSQATAAAPLMVLEQLRESGDESFLFLRTILELTGTSLSENDAELLFHCITGCRQVLLWRFRDDEGTSPQQQHIPRGFCRVVRDFFAQAAQQFVMTNGLPSTGTRKTTAMAFYTASAALWKRTSMQQQQQECVWSPAQQSLAQAMQAVFPSESLGSLCTFAELLNCLEARRENPIQHMIHAATLMLSLLSEISGTTSAVQYRLPLEFHQQVHDQFEKNALFSTLRLALHSWFFPYLVPAYQSLQPSHSQEQRISLYVATELVAQVIHDVLHWEYGKLAWEKSHVLRNTCRLCPPITWAESLTANPDPIRATWSLYHGVASDTTHVRNRTCAALRQVLLAVASLCGPVFTANSAKTRRYAFATALLDGIGAILQRHEQQLLASSFWDDEFAKQELQDMLQLVGRMVANYKLSVLVEVPTFRPVLAQAVAVGTLILKEQTMDCERAGGDVDSMIYRDEREECLALLLECTVLVCGDPYLLYTGSSADRRALRHALALVLGPLYQGFVQCRTRMASLEEYYIVAHEAELDEIREEIVASSLVDEMEAVATAGRLDLSSALACLSALFNDTRPQLQALWVGGSNIVTAETAALLEQTRLLTMYITHLLTDDNTGESPAIPESVLSAAAEQDSITTEISGAVDALVQFADAQVHKIAENPTNLRLSPELAKSFLWFLQRWVPAYVYPRDSGDDSRLAREWSTQEKAQQIVSFSLSLCWYYQCYWPLERQVQASASKLLFALTRRDNSMRALVRSSTVYNQSVRFHCLTADLRHTVSQAEFERSVRHRLQDTATAADAPSLVMLWGYQRLTYRDKASILTALLVASASVDRNGVADEAPNVLTTELLRTVHDAFVQLTTTLANAEARPGDVDANEMAYLSIELFCGVVHAGEMEGSTQIPQFVTPYLTQLADLMALFAKDMTVCESLLRFFRDYAEQFVAVLNREQSLTLFRATASLLKAYSLAHCESREITTKKSSSEVEAEEDQAYGDILTAIQLLVNLGTKDFIDACGSNSAANANSGVESSQVTDMIFFGLQQLLPLMSRGLLQYPTLCALFFDLIGFMMDTYPDKVCTLPHDLFQALMESLLYGMSHIDPTVAKCSLHGLNSIAIEHLRANALSGQLTQSPELVQSVTFRILMEVVLQSTVMDRMEDTGQALLPWVAINVNQFAAVVGMIAANNPQLAADPTLRQRLERALEQLLQPNAIANVATTGYQGRQHRASFKQAFQKFVQDVHSFLVLK
jgi:hypothetical protein